jgi:hypothetical protein
VTKLGGPLAVTAPHGHHVSMSSRALIRELDRRAALRGPQENGASRGATHAMLGTPRGRAVICCAVDVEHRGTVEVHGPAAAPLPASQAAVRWRTRTTVQSIRHQFCRHHGPAPRPGRPCGRGTGVSLRVADTPAQGPTRQWGAKRDFTPGRRLRKQALLRANRNALYPLIDQPSVQ